MHPTSYAFVEFQVARYGPFESVLEVGSRDINGTVRPIFEDSSKYLGIDMEPGPGVDEVVHVTDLAKWGFHCIVSTNALEHDPKAGESLAAMWSRLRKGGFLILTCAGPGFGEHSGRSESMVLEPGEHYELIDVEKMIGWVKAAGRWEWWSVEENGHDITVVARRA